MATKYIVQLNGNPNFCLGVASATANSPVVLSILAGVGNSLTQWYTDPNTGAITLVGSPDPTNPLYLDFQGTSPSNGQPAIVATFVLGRNFQKWNWVGNPPYVQNIGAPTYAIDNNAGSVVAGNKIQIWTQSVGSANQQWNFLAVPVLEAALAAAK